MAYKLSIGSFGWQFPSWENAYYPEDIPAEWQFAYYANDYSIIMIPQPVVEFDLLLLEQCVLESEESCLLLFELALDLSSMTLSNSELQNSILAFIKKIDFAQDRCIGLVCTVKLDEIKQLSAAEVDCLQDSLKKCQEQLEICIDIHGIDSIKQLPNTFIELLNKLGIDICRYDNLSLIEVNNATLHVTICEQEKCNAKQIRTIVENSLHAECENSTNVLIFRTQTPDHEQMHTAQVISELI